MSSPSTTFPLQDRVTFLGAGLCLAVAGLIVGCDAPTEIRVQDVPKLVIEPEEFAGLDKQPHTILAAMVPHGNDVWVFRLDGASEEVQSQREAFESFVSSLSFEQGQSRPNWKLPAGWEESAAPPSSLREATILVPLARGPALDLSVSRLPSREDWLHYRLRNFNRWRRQLQLPVAGADELEQSSKPIELDDSTGTSASVVAISGKLSESERSRMAARALLSQRSASLPAAGGSREPGLTYETPDGWGSGPMNSMRRASLLIADDGQQASMVVTAFPARSDSQMAEPLPNVNRWRGQVGLGPLAADELAANSETIDVDGEEGLFVILDGEGAGAGQAMRAAMVERGDEVWFFKLTGPQELVERETEPFREFLQSVEFAQE